MKCDGCNKETNEIYLVGQTDMKQQLCKECLGTKDSHITMCTLEVRKDVQKS